eukprot:10211_1
MTSERYKEIECVLTNGPVYSFEQFYTATGECKFCHKKIKQNRERHAKAHHNAQTLQCAFCTNKRFNNPDTIKQHWVFAHLDTFGGKKSELYHCDRSGSFCANFVAARKYDLTKHQSGKKCQ